MTGFDLTPNRFSSPVLIHVATAPRPRYPAAPQRKLYVSAASEMTKRPLNHSVVHQHEVLRPQECESVRDRVISLREHWTQRSDAGDFFTLGAAAYLDAPTRRDAYITTAQTLNSVLRENFEWLYERVRDGFEQVLGQPVSYTCDCALPGFHIFVFSGDDQSSDRPATRAHFDLQWMHAMPGPPPEETLSFTLLVEEPSGGSSMEIWPAHKNAVRANFNALQYAAAQPSTTLRYSRGYMVVHDGLLLHAIGRASIAAPKGTRITLQGHGARTSEGWKFYW